MSKITYICKQIFFFLFNFLIFKLMKKFVLLLMAALALPVMAQQTFATKSQDMRTTDRTEMVNIVPMKATIWGQIPKAEMNRAGETIWDFETEEQLEQWSTVDADGDGYAWEVDDYYSYNGGTYCLTSRSYYGGVLYPDNWLISPVVKFTNEMSFFAMNYMSSYPDKFEVYICVGDPSSIDNFVSISEMITPPTTWTQYTFDLSNYEGQTGCIALRHYDCVDEFRVMVDYFALGEAVPMPTTPEEVIVEPDVNEATVLWTDEDDAVWNLRYRVYTEQPEPTGYLWDFEEDTNGNTNTDLPAGWTTIDEDGDGYAWYHLTGENFKNHSGIGHVTSASYMSGILYPDNWLVSPKVTLQNSLSFWACGQDPSYAGEVFAVYVSTDNREWVKISDDITATGEMTEYTFDLSEFAGQEGYVAIRHYNVYDMFRLNVDDVQIGELSEPVEEAEWIVVEGIEDVTYVIEQLTENTTYEVQVQAVNEYGESDWTGSVIFTTGTPTSIEEIAAEVKGDNRYYNMMGQEVDGNNLPAGIYIHNGKKILVK